MGLLVKLNITYFGKHHFHLCFLFSSVQSLSHVWLLAPPWTAACQASLSITSSWSSLKLMSIESVMPANHLILYHPLLLLPSIFPSIRIFSNESVLCIRWLKYYSRIITAILKIRVFPPILSFIKIILAILVPLPFNLNLSLINLDLQKLLLGFLLKLH